MLKRQPMTSAESVEFAQLARRMHFFAAMKIGMLEKILQGIQMFEFDRGDKVCVQGEAGDFFFVVQAGRLQVSIRKAALSFGKKVAILGPGDCFGEMALLHEAPRNATITCLARSRVFALSALHFKTVLALNPEFAREINDLSDLRQFELDHRYN